MNTLYIGVDFHPHQQTISWCDTETGETEIVTMVNDPEEVADYYESFAKPAIIGIEASARTGWFENLIDRSWHTLKVGHTEKIRKRATSRHKNDDLDAELIMTLLIKDEFPAVWRRTAEQNEVLELLRFRQRLVGQRTAVMNRLQTLAHAAGLRKGKMKTKQFQEKLKSAELDAAGLVQRSQLFDLMATFNRHIEKLDKELNRRAGKDPAAELLMTQPGVGPLTALAVVNVIGDITRFEKVTTQVPSFAGLDPLERSSAGRRRFGSISKAGSPLLRYQLAIAAQIATRYDPKLKAFYRRLKKKKPVGVAKTAAARKLLVKLSIMLRDGITAEEFDKRGRTVGNARGSA